MLALEIFECSQQDETFNWNNFRRRTLFLRFNFSVPNQKVLREHSPYIKFIHLFLILIFIFLIFCLLLVANRVWRKCAQICQNKPTSVNHNIAKCLRLSKNTNILTDFVVSSLTFKITSRGGKGGLNTTGFGRGSKTSLSANVENQKFIKGTRQLMKAVMLLYLFCKITAIDLIQITKIPIARYAKF